MDSPASAFSVYQKRNKNKRKNNTENKMETLPLKKAKTGKHVKLSENGKHVKLNKETGFSILNKKNKHVNFKNKLETNKVPTAVVNGDTESDDDEMPVLVPMVIKAKNGNINEVLGESTPQNKKNKILDPDFKKLKPKIFSGLNVPVFNPVTQGLAVFKWLIDPITPREFFEKYWEKDVLYVNHSNPNYFMDIFSSDTLDSILREYPLYYTRNVDVVSYKDGKKVVLNSEGRAGPSQLWDYYNNGCSVRVLNPQTYDQNVHSIISSLQEYFGTMVGTNVYLTPPASQGFAPHFDDIEAFIIQLEGSKHWKLYKPKGADVLARDSSQNFKSQDLGKPFMEVTLNAGDLLYFPRGTIHEGRTQEGAHSLHITVSVYQHTAYVDLLEKLLPDALKKAANKNIDYRKGLPLNYLKHVGVVNQNENTKKRRLIINTTKSLVESLVDYLDVDSAADNLGRKFMFDAMPPLFSTEEAALSSKGDGDHMKYGKVCNRVEISTEVRVRLLRYYAIRVVKDSDETSKVYYSIDNAKTYHGEEEQWLEIDNSMIPAFEMLQKKYPEFVEVDKLPIDNEVALQLISDLWERGLLVTDEPLPRSPFDSDTDSVSSSDDASESDSN